MILVPSLQGGGAEKVATELLPYLSRKFNVILVLVESKWQYCCDTLAGKRIILSPRLRGTWQHIIMIPFHIGSLAFWIKATGTKAVLSFMEQANIINLICSFFTRHKAILSQRIMPNMQYQNKGILGKSIISISRVLYPRGAHIIAVSKEIKDYVLTTYGIREKNISFVPNPVNLQKLQEDAKIPLPAEVRRPYIVHIGRFKIDHKAQDMVLRVFSRLKSEFNGLNLVFVGDGPDLPKIKSLTGSLGLSDSVCFVGWQEKVAPFLANAELLLFPSRREGWPNVLLEAMACGCPVVAADCASGPKEILGNNLYGLLVPVNDSEALYNAANRLLEDRGLASYFRKQGLKRARDFAIEKVSLKYIKIIEKFC